MNAQNRQAGFSLIEMLVVVVIFSIVIIAASQSFVPLLSQSKQQSRIAVTNIEGMLGLEVMRRDITHAGYGLYWEPDPTMTATFQEVSAAADASGAALNEIAGTAPRAVVFGAGRGLNGSDRIAVKAVNVASNELSEKWTYLYASPTPSIAIWTPASENIGAEEYVVVVRPDKTNRYLMFNSTQTATTKFKDLEANYQNINSTSLVFSLGTTNVPKMPFNRADYYISNTNVPPRCAQGTGVLYKAVVDQTVGSAGFLAALPLMDCVADMQVGYRFASDNGAYADQWANVDDLVGTQPQDLVAPINNASLARQIREIRVYILAQEGQRDRDFTFPNNTVTVGEAGLYGRDFDLNATIANWQRYRWKLYTFIIEPICLLNWVENE